MANEIKPRSKEARQTRSQKILPSPGRGYSIRLQAGRGISMGLKYTGGLPPNRTQMLRLIPRLIQG